MKSKIKQLQEIIAQDAAGTLDFSLAQESVESTFTRDPEPSPALEQSKVSRVTTQDDLEMDETAQVVETMEMVPIGRIEEVAKKESRARR